jgi:hypothetical protein
MNYSRAKLRFHEFRNGLWFRESQWLRLRLFDANYSG